MIILNLGAGIQSTTVLLLSMHGELPKIDHAIFADTQWEPKEVYTHLEWLESISTVPVHRVTKSNIKQDALESQVRGKKTETGRWASLPYYTMDKYGNKGMIRRQCTSEYKIYPIEKYIRREILNLKPRQHIPKGTMIDQWFGISGDELRRVRASKDHWRRFCYPLVGIPDNYLGAGWTRQMCIQWLGENYPDHQVPRSACIGCPFHSNAEWGRLKDKSPEEWQGVVEFDRKIRKCGGVRGDIYLHRDCVPLDKVDLRTAEDAGQLNMFREECMGMCGV